MTEQVAQEVEVQEPQQQEVDTPASAQEQAEPPEVGTEQHPEGEEKTQTAKTFTQDEVDAIAAKERAIAERKAIKKATREYERRLEELARQAQPQQQQQQKQVEGKPTPDKFERVEDYIEAVTEWKLDARQKAQAHQAEEQRILKFQNEVKAKAQTIFEQAEQNPEFDMEEFEALTDLSEPMAYAIMDSEIAPQVMVHLQKNPAEVTRIAKLPPARQAAEIGKLELKLSAPKEVKVSKAPAPVKPIGARSGASSANPAEMSQAEFEAWLAKSTKR